jgi:hypothetical protein
MSEFRTHARTTRTTNTADADDTTNFGGWLGKGENTLLLDETTDGGSCTHNIRNNALRVLIIYFYYMLSCTLCVCVCWVKVEFIYGVTKILAEKYIKQEPAAALSTDC